MHTYHFYLLLRIKECCCNQELEPKFPYSSCSFSCLRGLTLLLAEVSYLDLNRLFGQRKLLRVIPTSTADLVLFTVTLHTSHRFLIRVVRNGQVIYLMEYWVNMIWTHSIVSRFVSNTKLHKLACWTCDLYVKVWSCFD